MRYLLNSQNSIKTVKLLDLQRKDQEFSYWKPQEKL